MKYLTGFDRRQAGSLHHLLAGEREINVGISAQAIWPWSEQKVSAGQRGSIRLSGRRSNRQIIYDLRR